VLDLIIVVFVAAAAADGNDDDDDDDDNSDGNDDERDDVGGVGVVGGSVGSGVVRGFVVVDDRTGAAINSINHISISSIRPTCSNILARLVVCILVNQNSVSCQSFDA